MTDVLPPRIVLNKPLYGGNVGASARAMTNLGLQSLRLCEPQFEDEREMRMFATGTSKGVLDAMERQPLADAVAGCTVVIACTARPRKWKAWALLDPTEAAELLAERGAAGEATAILFGSEDSGLDQADLAWATHLCHIPTAPEHSSLNLSQAVLLLGWEWARALGRIKPRPYKKRRRVPAPVEQVHGAAEQIGRLLDVIGFWRGKNRDQGLATVRQTMLRGSMTDVEVHFVRGITGKVQWFVDHGARKAEREAAEGGDAGDEADGG